MEWNKETTFDTPEAAVKALAKMGFTARTEEAEKTFLVNATKKSVDDAVKEHTKTMLDQWDNDIAEASGVKRESGVKTGDYIKGIVNNLKKEVVTITAERDDIKDKQLTKAEASKEIQLQFDTFKTQSKKDLAERDKTIANMKGQEFTNSINGQVSEAMGRIRPKLAAIKNQLGEDDASMLEMMIEAKLAAFRKDNKAVAHEGGLIYHNSADDTPILDKEGNHLSTFSILEKSFDTLIDKQHKAAGAGGGDRKPGGATDGFKITVPETVTNRIQLMDHILATPYKGQKLDQKNSQHAKVINELYMTNGGNPNAEGALPMK